MNFSNLTMCLYPKLIKNKKYLPNKKNGGNVPKYKDLRVLYVPIGCGRCIECRRQKANQWKTRLCEELKDNPFNYFITLTFSNESLEKLAKECESEEVNAIAAFAVRKFLERWRKKHRTSLRHWIITELGQENTERIHMHGIIFTQEPLDNDKLQEFWQYGRTDVGKYCNEQTISYIVKYVLKIDEKHKNYMPLIMCSAGIGKHFINRFNIHNIYRYEKGRTREYYELKNGNKCALPIYYKNKLFTEDEREQMWLDRLNKNQIFINGICARDLDTEKGRTYLERLREQAQADNRALGYGDCDSVWDKENYYITLKMLNKQ